MRRWLSSLQQWYQWFKTTTGFTHQDRASAYRARVVMVRQYHGANKPPSLHWKACNPSTIRRFKAEMTCSQGHSLVLKGHSVGADGQVAPSVVCRADGCTFHDFVRLEGWSAGAMS
jgi:hypothetical protein